MGGDGRMTQVTNEMILQAVSELSGFVSQLNEKVDVLTEDVRVLKDDMQIVKKDLKTLDKKVATKFNILNLDLFEVKAEVQEMKDAQ